MNLFKTQGSEKLNYKKKRIENLQGNLKPKITKHTFTNPIKILLAQTRFLIRDKRRGKIRTRAVGRPDRKAGGGGGG